jgi:uncharacterized repeat protein (TIGR03806 family)
MLDSKIQSALAFGLIVGCGSPTDQPIYHPQGADASDAGGVSDAPSGNDSPVDSAPPVDAAAEASDAAPGPSCVPPTDIYQPVEKLGATGCMDPKNPTAPAPNAIPYEVNSPLWSDSADKSRAFILPAGKKIHVKDCRTASAECTAGAADTGKWVFPAGTVMIKNFGFDGKLVETRLLMHVDDATWVGYSYQWNEAQTEATVAPYDRSEVMFATGRRTVDWRYPSRMDCMDCHTTAANYVLGLETAQMNRVPSGGSKNQLDRFQELNLFDAPLPTPYQAALTIPYPSQAGTPPANATDEQKARSYLHANCSFCHRPDGTFPNFDLRAGVSLHDMKICNVAPMKGQAGGTAAAKILVPGKTMDSIIWLRMNQPNPDMGRMPQLATWVVDTDGVAAVGRWITSLGPCP